MTDSRQLSEAKRLLLERWKWSGAPEALPAPVIERRSPGTAVPLSLAQERLWALHHLAGQPVLNLATLLRLPSEVDPQLLQRALREVCLKHEILRSVFKQGESGPRVEIRAGAEPDFTFTDLSSAPAGDRERQLEAVVAQEARRPFDLEQGPLVRLRLFRLGEANYHCLFVLHHIVADSASATLFGAEMFRHYLALAAGQEQPPPPPIQYADYAYWERSPAQEARRRQQLEYWKRTLSGAPLVFEHPGARPRPARLDHRGAQHELLIDISTVGRLRELARREAVTAFMLLLAVHATLLHRLSGQTDIVIGSPVLGRRLPELHEVIGLFINTVPLRIDLSGDPSFAVLLQRVRETVTGAYANQEVPIEDVAAALGVPRDPSRLPICQVKFNFYYDDRERLADAGEPGSRSPRIATGTSDGFDIALDLADVPTGIRAVFEYSAAIFAATTVERMAARFRLLLDSALATPGLPLSELRVMDEAEERAHARGGASRPRDWPGPACLHQRVAEQVRRTPGAIALEFEDQRLTYSQLDAAASRLAGRLRDAGIGTEARVGVLAERSPALVTAILGVLKAGAAYVPMDCSYPPARLRALAIDAGLSAVVCSGAMPAGVITDSTPVLSADAEMTGTPAPGLGPCARPDNAAYVIYTSGSTGAPKGVVVEHRAIMNRLCWTIEEHGFGRGDVFLLKTPFTFDASIWELFVPLMVGARLVLACPGGEKDASYLAQLVRDRGITVLQLVPSMLAVFLEAADLASLPSLRLVCAGGEALPAAVRDRFRGLEQPVLYNLYGPTEAAIDVAAWRCGPEDGPQVPIGRPIANTRLYVLDRHLRPVPDGVPGQLYVNGAGLARGYLGRPGATAERFLPDHLSSAHGARLYATGDIVRRSPNGVLIFLGRADSQVKLRGFRVELGEVESALRAQAGVQEAVAAIRGSGAEARLVAGVAPGPGASLEPAVLLGQLRNRLPESAIPSAIIVLERLPRLPSGKLDRGWLADSERSQPPAVAAGTAPQTASERLVGEVWREVVNADAVFRETDFFGAGGTSLLAVLAVTRLRRRLGIELPLPLLFEAPRLADFAERVDRLRGQARQEDPIRPLPRDGELPLSFAQQRVWFLEHFVPGEAYYNLPIPLRFGGSLDERALRGAVRRLLDRHEVLRCRFPDTDGRPRVEILPEIAPELEAEDVSALVAEGGRDAVVRLVEQETLVPFDLAAGPLVRARLLRVADDDHVLVLVIHHIVCDGWSTQLLVRELVTLYRALAEGTPPRLPELGVQYVDFAAWQRGCLTGERLRREVAYWEVRLAGAPAVLDLPADSPRPSMQSYRSGHARFLVDGEVRQSLEAVARSEDATVFMALLAGLAAALQRHSGQADIVIGSPVAGRMRPETEGLIGFFVNTLALRIDLSGYLTFRELLRRARATVLEALAHQEVPFEKLVEELRVERDLARTPLFQVMLAFQELEPTRQQAGGAVVDLVMLEHSPTRCDLTLYAIDTGTELRGSIEYAEEVFDAGRMQRFAAHLSRLLTAAVADPDRPLAEVELASEEERRRVLQLAAGPASKRPAAAAFPLLFERQARRTPQATAIACAGQELTYSGLEQRSAMLARGLLAQGVGPAEPVGVLMPRGPELAVAAIGVMRARAAYLPLDPAGPPARVAQVLAQSGARGVLVGPELRHLLPEGPWRELDGTPIADGPPLRPPAAGELAYVIFTSGSTGLPKGAMIEHRGMLNHLLAKVETLELSHADRVAQNATQVFDISIWQLLAPLLAGGTAEILPDQVARDPRALIDAIEQRRLTVVELVPGMLAALLEELDDARQAAFRGLRRLVVTGEALPADLCARWLRRFPAVPIVNAYGPTECSDDVAQHVVAQPPPDGMAIPIGRPLANSRLYVASGSLAPCPLGVPGELLVGGDSVGRGYVGEPGRTAVAFLPDPFSGLPGARVYRTGDLACHLSDGSLLYLGRIDEQVKIRGHRVELQEIEAYLRKEAAVADAAVVARAERGGTRRLVAYLQPRAGARPVPGEVRARLALVLPEYMVPGNFVIMESLPRTPSGKLDRKALPAPQADREELGEAYVPPQTPVEDLLAAIWAELLELSRVGSRDNFFALGGHSLLAMQLTARLRRMLRLEVPLELVFRAQTVAAMARSLEHIGPPGQARGASVLALRVLSMTADDVRRELATRDG
jgi:amino acid adenylation domain-containing protein